MLTFLSSMIPDDVVQPELGPLATCILQGATNIAIQGDTIDLSDYGEADAL